MTATILGRVYVYCAVGAGDADAAVTAAGSGLDGEPLSAIVSGGVAALVSPFGGERVRPTRAALSTHQRVVEAVREVATVLPVRFGTLMDGDGSVTSDLLEAHRERLAGELERVAGLQEIRLRVSYLPDVALREALGSDPRLRELARRASASGDFHAKLDLGQAAVSATEALKDADAAAVVDRLRRHAVAAEMLKPRGSGEDEVVHAAFLLEADAAAAFDRAVDALAAEHEDRMRFELVGPLAPWDFVDFDPGGAHAPPSARRS